MNQSLYVATRKGVFKLQNPKRSNASWRIVATAFLGNNVSAIKHEPETDTTFVALRHARHGVALHRTENGWARWQACATPLYPEKPDGGIDRDRSTGVSIPWVTQLVWTLETSRNGWRLWCGTIPGGLFMSNDAGDSWILVDALWYRDERKEWCGGGYDFPGIHSICVDPADDDHLTVGVSCGGIWVSVDAGNSWSLRTDGISAAHLASEGQFDANILDPHRVVQCRAAPDHLWVQHHNGVFRSLDRANRWTELESIMPSSFGFAAAVHPSDPNIAWFVPLISDDKRYPVDGRLVVARTKDGGKTFDVLENGLPQLHAYDVTLRHALDVSEDGDALAFGTTTGSLWISHDAGDSWTLVSAHLPPIHAVHFA